ncbi:hypothetical protein AU468_04705 [Alkalispirochaeta sphaeroplastigenens]|uniref:Uncharacterized protein n=1 Tax=Alkalispirochaeta sphaeroplastigenens TaxID=1187066 RepID=A0A2S4JWQ7_9SPIO|nr:hypothetical protein [Alkalispirochaeta sphaeroplastigenens]POR03969.1 hypothetical protein AU468_04705 [Alkalispirochaeta sphaeroplastigenens]
MKIFINDVPLEFQLEEEESLGSVVDEITRWLAANSHNLDRLLVDGSPWDNDSPAWREQPVASVDRVDISASSRHEEQITRLETLGSYASLLRRVLTEGSDDQLRAVLEELPFVVEGIARITPDLAGLLEEPLGGIPQDLPDAETRARAAARAGEMANLFEHRQRELIDPEHEMGGTLAVLDALLPRFEEIPGELQTGQEKQALDTIARFTEVASRLLRLIPRIIDTHPALREELIEGEALTESLGTIQNFLAELEKAFRNTDYILVGDLLEYEMLPRFSAISSAVAKHMDNTR